MKREMTEQELSDWMVKQISSELGIPAEKIDRRASLARYGLDSLQVVTLVSDLEDHLGRRLELNVAWEHPTVEGLAKHLAGQQTAQRSEKGETKGSAELASGMQHAIYMLQEQYPGTYLTARAFRLTGPLSPEPLRAALSDLTDRHPLLRTSYHAQADGLHRKEHPKAEIPITVEDGTGWSEEQVAERLVDPANQLFDPAVAPLARVHIIKRSAEEHFLVVAVSHLIFDAWSSYLMMHDFSALLNTRLTGEKPAIAPIPFRFSEMVDSERALLQKRGEELRGYWRSQLEDRVRFVPVPTDRPRESSDALWVLPRFLKLTPEQSRRVQDFAAAHDLTVFQVMLGAWAVLLAEKGNERRVPITSSVDVRRPEHRLTIGPFLNHVVFNLDTSGDPTVAEYLARVRGTTVGGLTHDTYPFHLVLQQGWTQWKDRVHAPLLQLQCNYYNFKTGAQQSPLFRDAGTSLLGASGGTFTLGPLKAEPVMIRRRRAPFDLSLWITVAGEELHCRLEYALARFEAKTVDALFARYQVLLMGLIEDPSRRLSAVERAAR
jgi:acyl carrier protein